MEIAEKILQGDIASASRLITMIENSSEEAVDALKIIFPRTGNAYVVGITGAPGAGKSTLICEIIVEFRRRNQTVGVIAVDATSPFSGGALLGDRVRMQKHDIYRDEGVFIRSMATRGNLGGLARATRDAVSVMDALGKDVIIVETVGVGQGEVDIFKTAHTTVVVLAPGMGDDIQAIKAGIMEIGDIFVVNKADRDGADKTVNEIKLVLSLGSKQNKWRPEIFKTIATDGDGIAELVEGLERHRRCLGEGGIGERREKQYSETELLDLLNERVTREILKKIGGRECLREYTERIIQKEIDPYTASDMLLERIGW